jgi:Fe-S-cluster containining protein
MSELDFIQLIGLGMTLTEYCATFLEGETPHFEAENLHFECTQCGECCERPGMIYLDDDDIDRIATYLEIDEAEMKRDRLTHDHGTWVIKVTRRRKCCFYVDKKCTVHPIKPQQCKSYPFWPENVCTAPEWREAKTHCEGIGRGREYDAETVRRILVGLEPS